MPRQKLNPVLAEFPQLVVDGLLFIDSGEQYILRAADGEECCIGMVGADDKAAIAYLHAHPTPDLW